jgi:hypothetical protein
MVMGEPAGVFEDVPDALVEEHGTLGVVDDDRARSHEPFGVSRLRQVRRQHGLSWGDPATETGLLDAGEGPSQFKMSGSGQTNPIEPEHLLHQPVRIPAQLRSAGRFIPLARREGVVAEVRRDEFDARLTDIMGDEEDVSITFPKDDLSADDTGLLKPGAVFYWIVGYVENPTGQRSRTAEIKFRRLPARRPRDMVRAKAEAESIRRELDLD